MTTQLDICNIALSYVGATPIESLTELSTEAIWCNTNYVPLKHAVLAERTWNFAEVIMEVSDPVAGAGGFYYPIPVAAVRVYRCYSQLSPRRQANWKRIGSNVLADYDGTIHMVVTDGGVAEDGFPPMFTQALAGRLAMEMALPIARSQSMLNAMVQLYEQKISAAAAADGSEGRAERHDSNELTAGRAGGYTL